MRANAIHLALVLTCLGVPTSERPYSKLFTYNQCGRRYKDRIKKCSDGHVFVMTHNSPATVSDSNANTNADVWELIQALVLGHVPSDRILELFYWGQTPGVIELVRSVLDLRPETRDTIAAFLAVADAKSVAIEIDGAGRLILSSPTITDAATVLQAVETASIHTDASTRASLTASGEHAILSPFDLGEKI